MLHFNFQGKFITNCIFYLLNKSPEYKKDARQHPRLYGSQTFSLGGVGGDIVENVH